MKKDQDVSKIKQFIHQVIPYKKEIIFFGSRTRGDFTDESDFDILIIVHRENIERRKLTAFQSKIKRLCAKAGLDADIIVRDRHYTEEMKNFPGNIIHSVLQTGVPIQ
ncbi:MAG: nucleotidyltransferase domain-containing protein [Candidatus Aminicenantes bacterium]|nr:nucleotidyltransferase domain-containing protein [Candidatus Aminicenantes bacterium]